MQVTQEYDAVAVLWEKMQRNAQVCLLHPNDIKILPSTGQKKCLIFVCVSWCKTSGCSHALYRFLHGLLGLTRAEALFRSVLGMSGLSSRQQPIGHLDMSDSVSSHHDSTDSQLTDQRLSRLPAAPFSHGWVCMCARQRQPQNGVRAHAHK